VELHDHPTRLIEVLVDDALGAAPKLPTHPRHAARPRPGMLPNLPVDILLGLDCPGNMPPATRRRGLSLSVAARDHEPVFTAVC
jgi:hypothetical protein